MLQIVTAVDTLIEVVYTNGAACGGMNNANLVNGTELIRDNYIEHLFQLHR